MTLSNNEMDCLIAVLSRLTKKQVYKYLHSINQIDVLDKFRDNIIYIRHKEKCFSPKKLSSSLHNATREDILYDYKTIFGVKEWQERRKHGRKDTTRKVPRC